ncbi:hypothetical protein F5887DRAFT_1084929 [Amanita rubescens]|nr:hypothetical protein F5887DRAFT_1084929 [Amanita rubescens]
MRGEVRVERTAETKNHGNGSPPVLHSSSSGGLNTPALLHAENASAPHLPHNTDIVRFSNKKSADVERDNDGCDTDTDTNSDASQFSTPYCTTIEHDEGYDADAEDSDSVYTPRSGDRHSNLESDDGYDADDEDNGL